ncbi:MAG: hypothetical protein KA319_02720 [Ferruginibacter sp.]|nr:hypothetical protein [Ferruginibacter sp.]
MNNLIRLFIAVIAITALPQFAYSQSLSINNDGSLTNGSTILDIKSVTRGLLILK